MRRFVKPGLMIVAGIVAALPAVLVVALGWYHTRVLGDPMGPGSGVLVVTLVFSVFWVAATMVALIWLLDHLGVHYTVDRREAPKPRAGRKERRRQRAGLELLATRRRAQAEAERESARRRAAQRQDGGERDGPEGP